MFKLGVIAALVILANGCAPASGTKYARHLNTSYEPSSVNLESYDAAQRIYGEAQAGAILAGAMDDAADER